MYLSVYKKSGVHMKFLSWIKISLKSQNIAVDLTELLYLRMVIIL